MSILVVDDLPGARLLLKTTLLDAGYSEVVTVESAKDAFLRLGMDDPTGPVADVDMILMDIDMPEINGVEACRRIKATPQLQDIPIIMVTGLADSQNLESAFAAGAVDYITKPPKPQEMLARIGSALDLKREMDRQKTSYIIELEKKNRELELAFTELENKNGELQEVSQAKTQILSTATHELKTPLTSIIGYIDIILMRQDKVGPLNEKQRRYLETVQRNAHRLKSLVDDLLDVSRIEADSLELCLADLALRQEIDDVLRSMEGQLGNKQIQVELNIPSDLGPVRGDSLRFCQVVTNLLSNACKYSPPGTKVTISAQEVGPSAQVNISDTGIGISSEDQVNLFTKFWRADNSSTREETGTGLGLYITKHLIEAHGGKIWAESQVGKGTTFSFTWPLSDTDPIGGKQPMPPRQAAEH